MKSFNEWIEENYNEIFGMFKKPQSDQPQGQKQQYGGPIASQSPSIEQQLSCPFCNTKSITKRADSTYYPNVAYAYQCNKCFKYWPIGKSATEDAPTNLDPSKSKNASGLIENYQLYLSGLISE